MFERLLCHFLMKSTCVKRFLCRRLNKVKRKKIMVCGKSKRRIQVDGENEEEGKEEGNIDT